MGTIRGLWKLAWLMLIGAGVAAQPDGSADLTGMRVERDIVFADVDDSDLALDLYLPEGSDTPPLIVWVHGGAWRFGSKDDVDAISLVRHGFAMASVAQRLSSVAPFPAQVHDLKAAVRYLRANAQQLGFDGSRIAISGASSGAHLAALVAVTNGSAAHEGSLGRFTATSSDVQALVSYFGASNLTSILDQSTPFGLNVRVPALELLFGGPVEDSAELARLASPVYFVDEHDPPMYLLHGDQDPQMPINQTHELHGAAKKAGVKVVFDVVHGAAHGGEAFYSPERTAEVAAFLHAVLED
ncbi:MAG: alpha/beta hydrolase [Gammaproteobacteria bacterium]|jgi:acetyl esterase/lipase